MAPRRPKPAVTHQEEEQEVAPSLRDNPHRKKKRTEPAGGTTIPTMSPATPVEHRSAAKPTKRQGSVIYVVDASLYDDNDNDPKDSSNSRGTTSSLPPGADVLPPPPQSGASTTACFEATRRALVHGILGRMAQGGGTTDVIVCRSARTIDRDASTTRWWNESVKRLDEPNVLGASAMSSRDNHRSAHTKLLHRVRRLAPRRSPHPASTHSGGTVLQGLYSATYLLRERHEEHPNPAVGSAQHVPDRVVVLLDGNRSRLAWPSSRSLDLKEMISSLETMGCIVRIVYMRLESNMDAEKKVSEDASVASTGDYGAMDVEVEGVARGADESSSEDECEDDDNDDDEEEWLKWTLHEDRIAMLSDIVRQTAGGSELVGATSLRQVLDATALPESVAPAKKDNVDIFVTSDLVIQATQSAMVVKKGMPTVRGDLVLLEGEDGKIVIDEETGEPVTDTVHRVKIRHVDGDVIDPDDIVNVVSYCRDRIPMCTADYLYVHRNDDAQLLDHPRYEVLGFMDASLIPKAYLSGPPKVLSGKASDDKVLVAALAQTLEGRGAVAVCTVTSKLSDSVRNSGKYPSQILGVMYPFVPSHQAGEQADGGEPNTAWTDAKTPSQVVFLQLPFKGEVKDVAVPSTAFDESQPDQSLRGTEAQASDDFIDAMRFRPGEFNLDSFASPILRSWEQTVVQRFLNPSTNEITTCTLGDPILSKRPAAEINAAKDALDQFWTTHHLPEIDAKRNAENLQATKMDRGTKGKRALYYKDWL